MRENANTSLPRHTPDGHRQAGHSQAMREMMPGRARFSAAAPGFARYSPAGTGRLLIFRADMPAARARASRQSAAVAHASGMPGFV